MRFDFDAQKSKRLRANPKRGIGFEEAQELFEQPCYLDRAPTCQSQSQSSIGRLAGRDKSCTLSFLK
jgi:uncharacterized DUF497 family protein